VNLSSLAPRDDGVKAIARPKQITFFLRRYRVTERVQAKSLKVKRPPE